MSNSVKVDKLPPMLTIKLHSKWVAVDAYIWRSWTGLRRIDQAEHHGPTYLLGTNKLGSPKQARECLCCYNSQQQKSH